MHMALNADEWLKLNTSYCQRLSAWLTEKACEANRILSFSGKGDLRCKSCNGLGDQINPSNETLTCSLIAALVDVFEADEPPEECTEDDGEDVFDEMDCREIDEDELDEELAALLPEYQLHIGKDQALSKKKPQAVESRRPKQVAVFAGRCRRCGGFMINVPERQFDERDEDVYRCFSCGWRTSPEYAWNRKNLANGTRCQRRIG